VRPAVRSSPIDYLLVNRGGKTVGKHRHRHEVIGMFVVVATGLAVMGGAVYTALTRTAPRTAHPDHLSAVLLFVSASLLVTALLVALARLDQG
jgi:hypothetical protein